MRDDARTAQQRLHCIDQFVLISMQTYKLRLLYIGYQTVPQPRTVLECALTQTRFQIPHARVVTCSCCCERTIRAEVRSFQTSN